MPYCLFHNDIWFYVLQVFIFATFIYFNLRIPALALARAIRKLPMGLARKCSKHWLKFRRWGHQHMVKCKARWRRFWVIAEGPRDVDAMMAMKAGSSTLKAEAQVKRSELSMAIFYGTFIFINGLVVSICLSAGPKGYEIFWSLFDTALLFDSLVVRRTGREMLLNLSSRLRIES